MPFLSVTKAVRFFYQMMISALFRDYAFLTSAYLLEPVDVEFRKTAVHTTGRNVLIRELPVAMKTSGDARTKALSSTIRY
jgi:indoleamine 2,3-dioxygenase